MTETLGYRLKRERTLRQLSQEALAKALTTKDTSINKSMISRWERDLDAPSTKNLRRLAEYFDRPLDYFLCDEDVAIPDLAQQLALIREKLGISRAEMAAAATITEEDLSRYEAEEKISVDLLTDFAVRFPSLETFELLRFAATLSDRHRPSGPDPYRDISETDLLNYMERAQVGRHFGKEPFRAELYEIPLMGEAVFTNPDTLKSDALFQVEADIEEMLTISVDTDATFCLRAPDDAMASAGIRSGDLVFVHQQAQAEDGAIAVVLVPGDDGAATRLLVRRVYHTPGSTQLQLTADDRSFPPLLVDLLENGGAKIIGKVTYTLTQPR